MTKHPLAIAWHEWKKRSPESFLAATLRTTKAPNVRLKTRLHAAFNAGAAAQRQIYVTALASADVCVETGSSSQAREHDASDVREGLKVDASTGLM